MQGNVNSGEEKFKDFGSLFNIEGFWLLCIVITLSFPAFFLKILSSPLLSCFAYRMRIWAYISIFLLKLTLHISKKLWTNVSFRCRADKGLSLCLNFIHWERCFLGIWYIGIREKIFYGTIGLIFWEDCKNICSTCSFGGNLFCWCFCIILDGISGRLCFDVGLFVHYYFSCIINFLNFFFYFIWMICVCFFEIGIHLNKAWYTTLVFKQLLIKINNKFGKINFWYFYF